MFFALEKKSFLKPERIPLYKKSLVMKADLMGSYKKIWFVFLEESKGLTSHEFLRSVTRTQGVILFFVHEIYVISLSIYYFNLKH